MIFIFLDGAGSCKSKSFRSANDTRPEIEQIIFACEKKYDFQDLERKLFVIEKIENNAAKEQLNDFYICSLSSKSVIYKGMFLVENIAFLSRFIRPKICFVLQFFIKDFQQIPFLHGSLLNHLELLLIMEKSIL